MWQYANFVGNNNGAWLKNWWKIGQFSGRNSELCNLCSPRPEWIQLFGNKREFWCARNIGCTYSKTDFNIKPHGFITFSDCNLDDSVYFIRVCFNTTYMYEPKQKLKKKKRLMVISSKFILVVRTILHRNLRAGIIIMERI